MRATDVRRANEKWRRRAPRRTASAGIMISKGPAVDISIGTRGATRATRTSARAGRMGRRKEGERKERQIRLSRSFVRAPSAACFVSG